MSHRQHTWLSLVDGCCMQVAVATYIQEELQYSLQYSLTIHGKIFDVLVDHCCCSFNALASYHFTHTSVYAVQSLTNLILMDCLQWLPYQRPLATPLPWKSDRNDAELGECHQSHIH